MLPDASCDHRRLAADLLPAVLAAGAVEMHHYLAGVDVRAKADRSPVTVADEEAEAILLAALARAAPDVPVVAEESAAQGRIPGPAATFFLVDPLDGTKEFINKRQEFTVNVALVVDGRPVFGVVYAPALGDLYVTLGANEAAMARVEPRPLDRGHIGLDAIGLSAIRTRAPDLDGLTAVASRSHMTPETEAFLARYRIAARSDAGSSLKFCRIARGDADIYPRLAPTMEWDTAAGQAVLEAAGGAVTEVDGQPLRYGKSAAGYLNPSFVAWGGKQPFPAR